MSTINSKLTKLALLVFFLMAFSFKNTLAQSLSLSITPPLTELTIQPGRQYVQNYQLTNNGETDEIVLVHLVPFIPADNFGNAELLLDDLETNYQLFSSWFRLNQPNINFGEVFTLEHGKSQHLALVVNPPVDAVETDYYFTLLFITQPNESTGITETQSTATIGTNILLTISEDGVADSKAAIQKFSAPVIVDSLIGDLIYTLVIKNYGSSFFKPTGKINIIMKPGSNSTDLTIAPQNILAKSTRQIHCLEGEKLIECKIDKPIIGLLKTTAEFNTDNEGVLIKESTTTLVFPFSIIFSIILAILLLKLISNKQKNK